MKSFSLRANVLSNFAAKAAQAIGVLVFTPLYLRFLSLEAMGLVGLWVAVRAFLTLLDFGMSTTLNREAAKTADRSELWGPMWTLEVISWTIAAVAAGVFSLSAPWIAISWLKLEETSPVIAQSSLVLFGIAAAVQLPTLLYQGALTGLERQVPMNGVLVLGTLLRDGGSLAALVLIGKSPVVFFGWQLAISVVICAAQRYLMVAALPRPTLRRSFDWGQLAALGSFTAGTGLISLSVMCVGLADRLVLTKVVSLGEFGAYAVAQTAAGAALILVSPITNAAFPRFVALFSQGESIAELYHRLAKFISVLVFPTGAVLIGLSKPAMLAWTASPKIFAVAVPVLTLLSVATTLNSLAYLPLQAQLATGWTRLALGTNLLSAAVYIPTLIWAAQRYGAIGAAWAQVALMVVQLVSNPTLMHRRILRGEGVRWALQDCLLPALPSLLFVAVLARYPVLVGTRTEATVWVVGSWFVLSGLTAFLVPEIRNTLLSKLGRRSAHA